MTNEEKLKIYQNRLNHLESRKKDNANVCRKIKRNIKNLK